MSTSEEVSKKSCGGLTRSEVTNLLQSVIGLHGIEVKDDRIELPGVHPSADVPKSELPDETKTTVILYKDITSISPFEARVEVLLHCGELYIFSTTDSIKTHINTHSDGKNAKSEKPTTAQDVAGNIWNGLEKTLVSGKK
ncbi:hypothetical protein [Paludibacter sp. 221]|uniref:hypothetical protein n=1 Tax=Paludibacter sp. 221 TaxID=2302939 RepID=UPI001EF1DFC7|nr:hypothetical protein [Paludibacter sp. 221]